LLVDEQVLAPELFEDFSVGQEVLAALAVSLVNGERSGERG
jgi:hypothetical protein